MKEERIKVWIHGFQTRMLIRIGIYWLIYLASLWNLLFVWRLVVEGPGNLLEQYGRFLQDYYPPLVLFIVLLPVAAWDAVKVAHRMVGPLVRIRQGLQDVAAGHPIRPLHFREGDYLNELKDDFNAMLESLQRRGLPVLKPAESDKQDSQRKGA
jgi:methyl-accepting chemotaxis protein